MWPGRTPGSARGASGVRPGMEMQGQVVAVTGAGLTGASWAGLFAAAGLADAPVRRRRATP